MSSNCHRLYTGLPTGSSIDLPTGFSIELQASHSFPSGEPEDQPDDLPEYSSEPPSSSYRDRLKPWVVVLLLPKMQRIDVARFHRMGDAEGHAQVLRQLSPDRQYQVMFDPFK